MCRVYSKGGKLFTRVCYRRPGLKGQHLPGNQIVPGTSHVASETVRRRQVAPHPRARLSKRVICGYTCMECEAALPKNQDGPCDCGSTAWRTQWGPS